VFRLQEMLRAHWKRLHLRVLEPSAHTCTEHLTRGPRVLNGSFPGLRHPGNPVTHRRTFCSVQLDVRPALLAFRRRAGQELGLALSGAPEALVPARVDAALRDIVEEESRVPSGEVGKESACRAAMDEERQQAMTLLNELQEHRRERTRLKMKRADLLAVGFQSSSQENKEFAALVVCAAAGIFAVSIHWAFFSIWGIAYIIYRRSTEMVRTQRTATDNLQETLDALKALQTEDDKKVAALRARASSWSTGSA